MYSLNMDKGKELSDLEALFIVVDKLIDKAIEEGSKKGVVLSKGNSNQKKVPYLKLKKDLEALYNGYAVKGCFSIGVCQTCTRFQSIGSTGTLGKCGQKTVGVYDTCINHSKTGGGFGV